MYNWDGSLSVLLRDRHVMRRGQQAFTDVCKGLYMLHTNQICHLDMKTPNVLIGEDGICKISDLGLGRRMDPEASMVSTRELSTLAWMSPEHCSSGLKLAFTHQIVHSNQSCACSISDLLSISSSSCASRGLLYHKDQKYRTGP